MIARATSARNKRKASRYRRRPLTTASSKAKNRRSPTRTSTARPATSRNSVAQSPATTAAAAKLRSANIRKRDRYNERRFPPPPIKDFPVKISMYQASVPRFVNILGNLSAILDKAQAYAEAKKIDPAVLLAARLLPDMLPMKSQIQIACDTAKGVVARLAGVDIPVHEDTEQKIADLKARIDKCVGVIK